jgi:hypothetical protein
MKIKRVFAPLVALITIFNAQAINISGIVKNNGGSGLEEVRVKLGKANMTTTTDSDGNFTLADATGLKH